MTPSEKAKYLVEKFYPLCEYEIGHIQQKQDNAKQCALICVDEILLAELKTLHKPEYTTFIRDVGEHLDGYELMDFYDTVKSEITKL